MENSTFIKFFQNCAKSCQIRANIYCQDTVNLGLNRITKEKTMKNGKQFYLFRMAVMTVMALCLAVAAYAKDNGPVKEDYQGVYKDEANLSGTAQVTIGDSTLSIGPTTAQNISTEGGGKLKSGIMTLGSWEYVYMKDANGKTVKIGLVIRIKAGSHDKAMLGLGKKFAEKLYIEHKDQFKFDGKVNLADIPADLGWNFHGTKR
jgi:hypothetical protein